MEKFGDRVKTFFKKFIEKITPVAKKTSIIVALVPIAISVVACSDKTGNQDLDQNNDGPGIENPINGGTQTGTQTPSTPSTPDVPVTPDVPDVPVTPDIPDVPVTPEKTEAEYKVECEEKLKEIALTAVQNSNSMIEFTDIANLVFNTENGTIYCRAKGSAFGVTGESYYIIRTNQSLDSSNYKDALETIKDFEASSITEVQNQTILKGNVSEEKYNDLCEYVLGEVGLEGAEVLNATQFSSVGGGMRGVEFTVLKGDKVYAIQANAHSGDQSTQEGHINSMLNSSTNEIAITSEENFEDFDAIGISLENMSFKQEINGEEVSMKLVKGENGKYALDFNFCSFGDDGFGL